MKFPPAPSLRPYPPLPLPHKACVPELRVLRTIEAPGIDTDPPTPQTTPLADPASVLFIASNTQAVPMIKLPAPVTQTGEPCDMKSASICICAFVEYAKTPP